jgi:hypothetical protein
VRTVGKIQAFAAALVLTAHGASAWAGDARKAYKGDHPRTDTAIFMAEDNSNRNFFSSSIVRVDDKSVVNFMLPGVFAVRVLPGTHKFVVQAIWDNTNSVTTAGTYKSQEIELTVEDMKPLHVYVARYRETESGAEVAIEDLGERPRYKTTLAPVPKF